MSLADPASMADAASAIPTGTVTFLFTDIEGSTRLLERLRQEYAILLADQRQLLRTAFAEWNGFEVDTQGDSFFVAFPRAIDALTCTVEAQRAIAAHRWPGGTQLRVRMALHTGEPIVQRTGYVGMDVHRAARIGAAAHGGQILVSGSTRELVAADMPPGLELLGLGEYRLKDVRQPVELYQVLADGLQADFPPLRTVSTGDEAPTPGEPPFKGLEYFDETDARLFFGREALTGELVERLGSGRFLAVVGASGSGKSSLVRAGVVPAIRAQTDTDWTIRTFTPTAHPLEALALALAGDGGSTGIGASPRETARLIDDLADDPRTLHLFARQHLESGRRRQRLLLVVDQFEEVFTLTRDEAERASFLDNLLTAVGSDGPVSVLLTLRADFYDRVATHDALRAAVSEHQEYIGPMSPDELRRAIEAPAEAGGWEFSPGLVDLILHDVGEEPGALPLLSHALLETWRRRRGNVMTLKAYAESGGVRGAIARTADRVFHAELDEDQQRIAQSIFLRLTELGEGSQDTRRRVALRELVPDTVPDGAAVSAVLGRLVEARLVTASAGTAEVAHEALIREWPTLRDWLSQDREALRVHRHLTEATQEWELLERDPGALVPRGQAGQRGRMGVRTSRDTQRAGARLPAGIDGAADAGGRGARGAAPARDRGGGAAGRLRDGVRATAAPARAAPHRRAGGGRRDGRGGGRPRDTGPAERGRGGTATSPRRRASAWPASRAPCSSCRAAPSWRHCSRCADSTPTTHRRPTWACSARRGWTSVAPGCRVACRLTPSTSRPMAAR